MSDEYDALWHLTASSCEPWASNSQVYGIRKDSPKTWRVPHTEYVFSYLLVNCTSDQQDALWHLAASSYEPVASSPQFYGIRKDSPKTWRVPHTEYVFSYLLENCGARRAAFNPYFFLSFMRESLVKKPDFFKIGRKSLSISQSALAIP